MYGVTQDTLLEKSLAETLLMLLCLYSIAYGLVVLLCQQHLAGLNHVKQIHAHAACTACSLSAYKYVFQVVVCSCRHARSVEMDRLLVASLLHLETTITDVWAALIRPFDSFQHGS